MNNLTPTSGSAFAAHRASPFDAAFAQDVLTGLSHAHKSLPCRWFYDARGSELFEAITELDEYYPTRTEADILQARGAQMAARTSPGSVLVEFGSGSSRKTELVIEALPALAAYIPIDVSIDALADAKMRLARRFPSLRVLPVVGDFLTPLELPIELENAPRLGFFPGSTIGNFTPPAARNLLNDMGHLLRGSSASGPSPRLIIGIDLQKDLSRLIPAYDDAKGVTAAFNLNLLARMNRELSADFDLAHFAHEAVWNAAEGRVEMHLVSTAAQSVVVAGQQFAFADGERIHTENSYKYTLTGFHKLAQSAGWQVLDSWTDADSLFSVHDLVFTG